jgi:uncharacterized membrane protein affecting hemolysin expression
MGFDEVDGMPDDLARSVVIVQHVKAVAASRVIAEIYHHILADRLVDESLDRFVQQRIVESSSGHKNRGDLLVAAGQVANRREPL